LHRQAEFLIRFVPQALFPPNKDYPGNLEWPPVIFPPLSPPKSIGSIFPLVLYSRPSLSPPPFAFPLPLYSSPFFSAPQVTNKLFLPPPFIPFPLWTSYIHLTFLCSPRFFFDHMHFLTSSYDFRLYQHILQGLPFFNLTHTSILFPPNLYRYLYGLCPFPFPFPIFLFFPHTRRSFAVFRLPAPLRFVPAPPFFYIFFGSFVLGCKLPLSMPPLSPLRHSFDPDLPSQFHFLLLFLNYVAQ